MDNTSTYEYMANPWLSFSWLSNCQTESSTKNMILLLFKLLYSLARREGKWVGLCSVIAAFLVHIQLKEKQTNQLLVVNSLYIWFPL